MFQILTWNLEGVNMKEHFKVTNFNLLLQARNDYY